MPIKKEYKSKTYGLQAKQCIKLFNQQVKKAKDCKGYDDFIEDVKILRETVNNQTSGMPSMLTSIWIKRICEMNNSQLKRFVDNYKKGELNPFRLKDKFSDKKEENN